MSAGNLTAGAAAADITPASSMFLYGYPHVERYSEGVHDRLAASALVLDDGSARIAMCAVDLIFVSKRMVRAVRRRVAGAAGIPPDHVMVSCTHTHSGPITVDMVSNSGDRTVPRADESYVAFVVDAIAGAIIEADRARRPCELALTTADATGIGGNRRSDLGPVDPEVPVLVLRDRADHAVFAVSTTYCMHPTVLHEDSKLISADFPGFTRSMVREGLGAGVVHLYHTGPEGDQSPRRYVAGNTFDEAERLGSALGARILDAVWNLSGDDYRSDVRCSAASAEVMLTAKSFPPVVEAERRLEAARARLAGLRESGAPHSEARTAECDVFGAEEAVTLARCAADGRLESVLSEVLPVEVQVLEIAGRWFVCLPGELFVEYSLRLKERSPAESFVIGLANGELQGYIVTEAAAVEGGYEAGNSLFPPAAGARLIDEAIRLVHAGRR